ncbi:hypothetical protein RB195_019911 [Necator americanus]|uniref:Potassium channel domain-containing protein n=1 Tax=Necator americanus TaxID=51031 RepID=A0ABR1CHW5_NECAM
MDQQLREIEGLLETNTHPVSEDAATKIKKYVKLVLPHVALVAVVCLYAVIGAYIFYRLESPNEDRLKSVGKALISDMRGNLVTLIRTGSGSKDEWRNSVEGELYRFNDKIYKAFKEQYVRYADVRVTQTYPWSVKKEDGDRPKRHRNTKLRGEKSEKMWTASSALFFAATTMATIGYGNIVPATSSGRIACVVFALFGAPLAIITIGDLGKFLSECTIWLYKEMKKGKALLRTRWRRFRGLSKEHQDAESQSSSSRSLEWEDLVMDKTEVPVFMVFTILLLYIAFGGILFSFLEGWTYMDAFYYSFISLTTIGFGDIVPENHDYIVLMLAYLGIGLAVTTMCIDLVGIQYIQKIHYFGRKFRGTDLLHLLKRKRMIERRLAMGQGEEILQMYIQQMQSQLPDPVVVDQQWEEDKTSSHLEWQIDDALVSSHYSYDFPLAIHVPSPNVLSIRSYRPPSIYSNTSASARSFMLKRWRSRGESWDESGPSISEHCSLSTEPSVHIRQAYWDNYQSPNASLSSFEYEVPLPSPDYQGIALSARRSRRLRSCPSGITVPASQSVRNRSLPESARRQPCFCTQHDPLLFSPPLSFRISKPFMLSKLAVQCDSPPPDVPVGFESPPVPRLSPMENVQQSELCYPRCFTPSVVNETIGIPRLELSDSPPPSSRRSHRFRSTLFSIPEWRQSSVVGDQEGDPAPLMKRKKRERLARLNDPLHNVDWLNVSPRVMQLVKDDLPKLFEHVRDGASSSSSIVLVSPRTPIGMACMEDWDSYIRMLEEYNKPYERVIHEPVSLNIMMTSSRNESAQRSVSIPLAPKPKMAPTPSSVQKLPPTNSAAPPCVVDITRPTPLKAAVLPPLNLLPPPSSPSPPPKDPTPPPRVSTPPETPPLPPPTPPRLPTPVTPPVESPPCPHNIPSTSRVSTPPREPSPPRIHLPVQSPTPPRINSPIFVDVETEVEVVPEEHEHVLVPSEAEDTSSPAPIESSSEEEDGNAHDLDLGAFELVDSGMTAETLLSTEEPVIYHQDLPVHSVHHDTVQTEAALANLMSAPSSMLTGAIPPTMVEDNYCFVVDGERVRMGDILGDDQWWRHTSRPTKYFYSEDLRQFHRVNCIAVKGKVITAKLASGSLQVHAAAAASSASTPRSSVSGASARSHNRDNKVPLAHVYKVIRFYSFWKTCTSFHRIVTMIDRVTDDRHVNPDFKKRLFVQYLWRNAKAVEKARVQKEFDPRRQRLLRFVTDPSARKRFQKM